MSNSKGNIPKWWGKLVELERESLMIDLYAELRLEQDEKSKDTELTDEWIIPDEAWQQ